MGYDCGDSLPFDFEPNGIQFGSESKGNLSPRSSYSLQFERKLIFFSVGTYVVRYVVGTGWRCGLTCEPEIKNIRVSQLKVKVQQNYNTNCK